MSIVPTLHDQLGVEKLKQLAKEIDFCLFCTHLKTDDGSKSRPMSTQEVDDEGNIWFFSGIDSEKNRDIGEDNTVQLMYSHPPKSSFMIVNGEAEIVHDRAKIEELWSPLVKTWFKGGKDDPNLSLIKVNTKSAYYWDTEGNSMVNFIKMLASVATGTSLVDSKEGGIVV
jgi:general stress protein 26